MRRNHLLFLCSVFLSALLCRQTANGPPPCRRLTSVPSPACSNLRQPADQPRDELHARTRLRHRWCAFACSRHRLSPPNPTRLLQPCLNPPPVAAEIERRMAEFSMAPVENGEPLHVLKYKIADDYRVRVPRPPPPPPPSPRRCCCAQPPAAEGARVPLRDGAPRVVARALTSPPPHDTCCTEPGGGRHHGMIVCAAPLLLPQTRIRAPAAAH